MVIKYERHFRLWFIITKGGDYFCRDGNIRDTANEGRVSTDRLVDSPLSGWYSSLEEAENHCHQYGQSYEVVK